KGYECDEALGIQYYVDIDVTGLKCVDPKAVLAVKKKIADVIHCHDDEWVAEGGCCGITRSFVCARACDVAACPAESPRNPLNYGRLAIENATESTKCAVAKCQYGFVAVDDNGSLLFEYPAHTHTVSCSATGKWSVSATEKHSYVMCKGKPKPCSDKCTNKPWQTSSLKATSPAIRDGCEYSCPAGQALSRRNGKWAITLTSAKCTPRGILTDNGLITDRIGCMKCDVPDGPIVRQLERTNRNTKPGISTKCVLRCPKGYDLRYRENESDRFLAPGNVLYRQIRASENFWITRNGFVLTRSFRYDCV
ncbi:hypothetical protein PENTCL1PPCAC_20351, partial [Pristionchus entomophagus]